MRQVTAPDGTVHVVRIEWIGNRIRRAPSDLRERIGRGRKRTGKVVDAGEDVPSGCIPVPDEFALVAIVVVAVLLFFVFVTPLLAGLIELLALALIAFGVWGFRILFRRPWRIVHETSDGPVERCLVVGWRRSHRVMNDAADEVAETGEARQALRFRDHVHPIDVEGPESDA